MADINKTININVNAGGADNQLDDLSKKLDNVNGSTTKITQSTNLHTKSLNDNKKSVLDNGGAMGILGAATGGLAMDFKDAIEAIELTGVSLKGLRGAIIATGIGALALILLELITNWEKWIGVIDGSTKATERLNDEIAQTVTEYEKVALVRGASIAQAEAYGATETELHRQRMAQFAEQKSGYDELIAKEEEKLEVAKKSTFGNQDAIDKSQAEIERLEKARLKNSIDANTEWQKEQFRIQDELINAQIEKDDLLVEKQKKANQEKLASDKKYLQDSITQIQKYYDDITTKSEELTAINNSSFGETYNNATKLFKLSTDLIQTQYDLRIKLAEVNAKIAKSSNDAELQQLITQFNELEALRVQARNRADAGVLLATELLDQLQSKATTEIVNNEEIINQYIELNKLKLEEVKINNQLFEYEKSIDGRLNNSNQYYEIEDRINTLFNIRKQLIEETKNAERSGLQDKQNELQSTQDQIRYEAQLLQLKVDGLTKFSEKNQEILDNLANEALLAGKNDIELLEDKNNKFLDLQVQLSTNSLAINKVTSDLELELAVLTSDKKFQIESNRIAQEQMLRDERLDREKQYYSAVIGIASESSGFLDALISNGHLRDKKAAENALALRKVIGVASVVIAGQEEIRGIWANPSLSALPDTGIVSKTLLTAAAVARGGLSIATILAQKLSGGGSMGTGSAGAAAPQANFNVVGSSSNNQLAATIAAQQQQPVKAYVVGADMSTQQALDRNIQKNATFI